MKRLLFGITSLTLSVHEAGAQSCLADCSQPTSSYCLYLKGTLSNVSAGFSQLYEFIRTPPVNASRTLQKAQLQLFFGMQDIDDVCKRSETTLSKTEVTNDGPSYCLFTATLSKWASTQTVKGSIGIPPHLRLRVEFAPVMHFAIDASAGTAMLYLGDTLLQSDWGGHISDIWLSVDLAVIKTENGCIRYQFK